MVGSSHDGWGDGAELASSLVCGCAATRDDSVVVLVDGRTSRAELAGESMHTNVVRKSEDRKQTEKGENVKAVAQGVWELHRMHRKGEASAALEMGEVVTFQMRMHVFPRSGAGSQ